nr:PAS domain S-box protein [Gemmatimonadaceae bacterium]
MSASHAPPPGTSVARHGGEDRTQPGAASSFDWRALFEALDDGFCLVEIVLDAAGRPEDYRIVDANTSFARHTGLINAIGRNARELIPGLEQHWVDLYGGVALTGEPVRREQGSAALGRWFEVHAFPVTLQPRDPGALPFVAIVFRDITPRRTAELALLESERRFREVADHAPVMMWMTEADGRCTFLN